MLHVAGIAVSYGGIRAIDRLSITVGQGEVVTIIGANGAGKTTTLMTISGFTKCDEGHIEFLGERIDRVPPYRILRRGIVQVPEGRQIFGEMTVMENLRMGAYAHDDKEKIRENLDRVTSIFPILKERAKQRGATLSGGESQMLAIARGLMSSPRLLMLDEPSLGLAPLIVREIFKVIHELHERGMTVLLVEQNARQALQASERAYVMQVGKITMQGKSKELMEDEDIIKAYLGKEKEA